MTKLASMPVYGKNPQKSFPTEPMNRFLETWHAASGTRILQHVHKL